MIELQGNYYLNLNIGGVDVPLTHTSIKEFTITQDIDRILPSFRLAINDSTGNLGNLVPYDNTSNSVRIDIARFDPGNMNVFNFKVKQRLFSDDDTYEVVGLLDTPNLLTPNYYRAHAGNVIETLQSLAGEFGIAEDNTEIGVSLDFDKVILQPGWTNGKLLTYMKNNLAGRLGEGGYYAYIKNSYHTPTLVFKSSNELLAAPVRHKFVVGTHETLDLLPIVSYEVVDNSAKLADFVGEEYSYSYFDYNAGVQVEVKLDIDNAPSITPDFLINNGNKNQMTKMYAGRSNDFTSNFEGIQRNLYYSRLDESIQFWATTWGSEHITPGDTVLLVYSAAMEQSDFFSFQHSGKWLVKRVVHCIGDTFTTTMLLTRSGIDTQFESTLHPAKVILQ